MAVFGNVRGLSNYYKDRVERQEIHVEKQEAQGLPITLGCRVLITLVINGERFAAGLRSTRRCKVVWICPNMTDSQGGAVRLADALEEAGFKKNQRVELVVAGNAVTVQPA
jgi:hypothetical protein